MQAADPIYFETLLGAVVHEDEMTILGVSIATEGVAKGHNVLVDRTTLEQMKELAEEFTGGLKVKIDHFSGFSGIVGSLLNFRIKGKKLLADLHLLKAHDAAPLILEMASRIPDTFGLSASFSGPREEKGGLEFARVTEMYSADLVDQPAANPDGLFHQPKRDTAGNKHTAVSTNESQNMSDPSNSQISADLASLTTSVTALAASVATVQASQPKPEMTDETKLSDMTVGDMKGFIAKETATQMTALGFKPSEGGAAAGNPKSDEDKEQAKEDDKSPTDFTAIVTSLHEGGMKKGEAVSFAIKQPANAELYEAWKLSGGSAHFFGA